MLCHHRTRKAWNSSCIHCGSHSLWNVDGSRIVYNEPNPSCELVSVPRCAHHSLLLRFLLINIRFQREPSAVIFVSPIWIDLGRHLDLLLGPCCGMMTGRSRLDANLRQTSSILCQSLPRYRIPLSVSLRLRASAQHECGRSEPGILF
jgi:hypothetical protein